MNKIELPYIPRHEARDGEVKCIAKANDISPQGDSYMATEPMSRAHLGFW